MPVHDWTRVEAGIFHDFHTVWIGQIRNALNEGLLPAGYYALKPRRRWYQFNLRFPVPCPSVTRQPPT